MKQEKKSVWEVECGKGIKADNLAAIFEKIVWTMWDPQHLTTL
jgi:hypothetical protein